MKTRLTKITAVHYVKLVYRSALLVLGIVLYVLTHIWSDGIDFSKFNNVFSLNFGFESISLLIIWLVYFAEMLLRFFPSRLDSMGCQKQFKRNYEPTGREEPLNVSWKRTFVVTAAWLALNGIIGGLYLLGVIDAGALLLVSLTFGVCDMVCILFYCPFHSVFFKNRCCTDCRIYNWDFAMIFTPFVFVAGYWFTGTLLALSLALLIRWELTYKIHPERFSTNTNKCLDCAHCTEKLCRSKPQLARYIKKNKDRLFKK